MKGDICMNDYQVGVVIVTYNRLHLLSTALEAYDSQTKSPKYVLVIDNCSTDGTKEYLDEWKTIPASYQKHVVHNNENKGGSGGFHDGLERTLTMDAEWIWIADDDAFPESNALENAQVFLSKVEKPFEEITAICGAVINHGEPDLLHRRSEIQKGVVVQETVAPAELYEKNCFEINCFSYVGTIINKEALKKNGITDEKYYICYDDSEHSLRLREYGKIYCVPSIVVHHNVAAVASSFDWKTYYYYRNNLHMIKTHFPIQCTVYLTMRNLISGLSKLVIRAERQKGIVILTATRDALLNRLGRHAVYKPGWKPEDQ